MKTRRITRARLVPHTVDGKTRMVPDDEIIEVPLPPRDWDQIALNTVTVIVTALVLACVVWSTVSIGDLLSRVVIEPAAYGAAAVFDLAWIALMIIEWLARYTPARARAARYGGYAALLVAMGAVGAHGWLAGDAATGMVGAVVSGLAKGTWTILLAFQAVPLDKRTAAFLEQELSEAAAELSRIPVDRRVNRARALRNAERRALEADAGSVDPDRPDDDADDPDPNVLPINPGAPTLKDAVRTAWDSGFRDKDSVARYVGKATGKAASPETVERYLRALRVGA
ncbi:protein transporter Sec31 [Streptomyces sp. SGAir0957]